MTIARTSPIAFCLGWILSGCAIRPSPGPPWTQLPQLPDPLGIAAPFAGTSKGVLVVAGGANFPGGFPWQGGTKVWHDDAFVLSSPTGQWNRAGRLPRPLAYGLSITTGSGIICIGGSDAKRHYADVFRLIWANGALRSEPLPSLPVSLANAAGALVHDSILICGGSESPGEQDALNRLFAMRNTALEQAWRELEPLPGRARILPVAAAFNGALYVFGGVSLERKDGQAARAYLREAWRYRMGEGWRRLADAPHPVAAAPSPAPVIDGEILLVAGDDGSRIGFQPAEQHPGFPARGLAYDPLRDTWREFCPVPAPRATVPCVEWRGRFVIPSGEVRPGVRSPEVWSLHAHPGKLAAP